ncbi:hypothetical protein R3P38DRAFT_2875055 [Favolaschia claudopus]|uniref:F-box domain-containing protein n=1 Tax=Favolaschia claudopus TaxID=2862362 RepID=A0AAW0D7A2_9AGAR
MPSNYAPGYPVPAGMVPSRPSPHPRAAASRSQGNRHEQPIANRIPPEIATIISKYMDVRDLARAARVWRPITGASQHPAEYIKMESEKYSLLVHYEFEESLWSFDTIKTVLERMRQYNFAWSTLQHSSSISFAMPGTTANTMWAGSFNWKSGVHFMGESNGYMYEVISWKAQVGPHETRMQTKINLKQLPSLRTGKTGFKERSIHMQVEFVKAVCVEPLRKLVGILVFNSAIGADEASRTPILHVYRLNGQYHAFVDLRTRFNALTEVSQMDMRAEMVCIVAHYPSFSSSNGLASHIFMQNIDGERRVSDVLSGRNAFCTGFQFIAPDLWIATWKEKLRPYDTAATNIICAGFIECPDKITEIVVIPDALASPNHPPPDDITLIRNVWPSHDNDRCGPFYNNPKTRLFGLKYDYRNPLSGLTKSHCCLFGADTVESWVDLREDDAPPPERMHWLRLLYLNAGRTDGYGRNWFSKDFSNPLGVSLIGRRLFYAEPFAHGWSLNVIDYNPGAGSVLPHRDDHYKTRNMGDWQTSTGLHSVDPYPVAHTTTTPLHGVVRAIPTADGILLKKNDPDNVNYTMLLM